MRLGPLARAAGLACATAACAPALRPPPPVARLGPDVLAPGSPARADVDAVLAEAEARFARRGQGEEARAAQRLYLLAARADAGRIEGLLGLARATSWLVEHEADRAARRSLAALGVDAARLCLERDPEGAACHYALAIALGQQARERPATGRDALPRMLRALEQATTREPTLDDAGPHCVLALVLLRAPRWPAGPGDPEAGLRHAEQAVVLRPHHPRNLLALAEALRRNGRAAEARAAARRALEEARQRAAGGDPDAPEWSAEAAKALDAV